MSSTRWNPFELSLSGILQVYYPNEDQSNKGIWQHRDCILNGKSTEGHLLLIHNKDSADSIDSRPEMICPLRLVTEVKDMGKPHMFALLNSEDEEQLYENIPTEIIFNADSADEVKKWLKILRRATATEKSRDYLKKLPYVPDGDIYDAVIEDTRISSQYGMEGTHSSICVTKDGIFLLENDSILNHWPFRCIRRYGSRVHTGGTIFYLEAGRKSCLGDGTWTLKTAKSAELSEKVKFMILVGKTASSERSQQTSLMTTSTAAQMKKDYQGLVKESDDIKHDYNQLKSPLSPPRK